MVCKLIKRNLFIFLMVLGFIILSVDVNYKIPKAVELSENMETHQKTVFLTFDDGPSPNNTPKILKILKEQDVKATFFIIGRKAEDNKEIIKVLAENGMAIYAHSYTHDYGRIYKSAESYFKDLEECNGIIENLTGIRYHGFTRFPGGADNRVSNIQVMNNIKDKLKEFGIRYVDWNVSSGDAAAQRVAANRIKDNVIGQCGYWDTAVILMHDSGEKTTTVEALPYIISYLKSQGYIFKTFNEINEKDINKMIKYKIMGK